MPEIEEESTTQPAITQEPTIDGAFSDDGVDLTVIRWMLELEPVERLQAVQDLIDAATVLRAGDDP